ncbi:ankyrin repeat domain-containing protein [Pedobacter sp. SYP-B3415]|uniref:ankyrin repeat domain-containing protein n=1 Tax=Pedobacter sp. SYP-B3415 TaxID=2496641 RepID=UPI00101CFED1|nr:ankyrin repeat domain-containing protein [Pedobacter sp. SYP-B3415]
MTNDYNSIKEAYHRNLFASADDRINILSLYQGLPTLDIKNEMDEDLYHLAARFADRSAIEFLHTSGLQPASNKYGNTALHSLTTTKFDPADPALEDKAEQIYHTAKLLLEAGVNPKKKDDSGKQAYVQAAQVYMYPFIQAMADAHVKMDAILEEGKNLLHLICDKLVHRKSIPGAVDAATKTVRILFERGGIDTEDKDIFNTTPLTYAQRSGVKEIAALLSGNKSDVATGGMTIHEAVLNRDTTAVEALIKAGVDLNEVSDQYRRTALMLACEYPSAAMVELLSAAGADVNFRTGNGETAVFYLLAKAVSNFGRGMSNDLKDIRLMLRTLIAHGLDINAPTNNESDTALHMVCQAGYLADLNLQLAEEIVEAGCDINKANLAGKTPLMSFAERGNEPRYGLAELLLDNHADTGYTDRLGNTALIYAAGNSDKMSAKRIVSLLLDQDSSTVGRVNNAGQSAMDMAVNNDNEAVVKLLLEATV